jgi:lambda family phage tail tape measure protein
MATIESFVLKIKVEGQKSVDDLSKAVANVGAGMARTQPLIDGIVGSFGGMNRIVGASVTAFVGLGFAAIKLADDIGDISDATGVSAGALLNFKQSLIEAGGSAEDFSTLAAKLNQNIGDAAGGSEKAQQAFKKLGVFVTDAGGKVRSTESILQDAIGKLAAIEDPAQRASMAVDIFGKNAAKIDFTKLNAFKNPIADEDIKQLVKYQGHIDSIRNSLERKVISFFAGLTRELDAYNNKLEETEKKLNAQGRTSRQFSPGGPSVTMEGAAGGPSRRMTEDEKRYLDALKTAESMTEDHNREMARLKKIGMESSGGFGADTPAMIASNKAIANAQIESQRFAALAGEDARTAEKLKGANDQIAIDLKSASDIKNIQINLAQDIKKINADVIANDKISSAQQSAEIAAKSKELQTKSALEIQKIKEKAAKDAVDYTMKMNAKIYSEEESQRQKAREEIAAEEDRINNIIEANRKVVAEIANQNNEMAAKAKFSLDSAMMTDNERANAQALFDIEQQRLQLLKQIADNKELPYAERLAAEKKVNDLLNQRRTDAQVAQNEQQLQREDFTSGWEKSYRQYVENSTNAAQQGQQAFETLSRGFEDAFTRMFRAGEVSFKNLKAGFKDLANAMIADFIRIQAQKALLGLFGGGGGFLGKLFGGGSDMAGAAILGLPGYANGGSIPAGQLSVVGERGPELFIPKTAGTIVPNGAMGGTQVINNAVTYSIQAVDASSFRSMLARDPEFIHNVAEQGRRQMPIRSRR